MEDIRDVIFRHIINKEFEAIVTSEREGILSGVADADKHLEEHGIKLEWFKSEGDELKQGDKIVVVKSTPKKIAIAEEKLIGTLAKYSGVATAAKKAVDMAKGKVRIVAGSWKKMPPGIKTGIRTAVEAGGAFFRISTEKMIYLDKNYIKMLGSIPEALAAVKEYSDFTKVIQIKGEHCSIEEETRLALLNECNLLMVDTGNIDDLIKCIITVNEMNMRNRIEVAFAGNVKISNIEDYINLGIDVLCIGKDIIDAPLLDMKIDVMV